MDRRAFIESCSAGAASFTACVTAGAALPAFGADAKPKGYARALLTNEFGDPLKASALRAQTNYVFHYPFEATPVFLLNLGVAAQPQQRGYHKVVADHDGQGNGRHDDHAGCR